MAHDPSADDPRFPNRPKHLDFMRLSQVVQEVDRLAEVEQVPVEEIVGVDMASLIYTLEQRLGTFSQRTGQDLRGPVGMTLWLDGFTAGKRFAEAKAEAISDRDGQVAWLDFEPDCTGDGSGDPDKHILTIADGLGTQDWPEEVAVIVHRTVNGKYPLDGELANEKRRNAQVIVDALNAWGVGKLWEGEK